MVNGDGFCRNLEVSAYQPLNLKKKIRVLRHIKNFLEKMSKHTHINTQSLLGNLSWLDAVMKFMLPIPQVVVFFSRIISQLSTQHFGDNLLPPTNPLGNAPLAQRLPTLPSCEEAFMQMTLKTHQP